MLVDPRRLGGDSVEHAAQCPACQEFLVRSREDEARLAAALRVPVPEGLHARLLDRTVQTHRPRWQALAASLLAAVAVALALGWPRNDAMALAGIDFVVFDEAQAIADAKPTDLKVLARVARELGVSLPEQLGEINYVCLYPFTGGAAHHLLVKTPHGKITLLLIPSRPLASRTVAAARGLEAVAVPAAAGSVVIIGESGRSIGRVETLLISS